VPTESEPLVEGPAPGVGDPVNRAGTVKLPTRDGATTTLELAKRFVQAGAAADWDPDRGEDTRIHDAETFAGQFLAPEVKREWEPNEVRVVEAQFVETLSSVAVTVTSIGRLESNGVVSPVQPDRAEVQFQATTVNGALMLSVVAGALPSYLMLSLDGLTTLFEERAVYFYDNSGQFLVPDRRYVSRGISDEKRARAIIKQWLAGPSEFLKNVVTPPPVMSTFDNPELNGDKLQVNLPTIGQQPDRNEALRRIARQIRWSVHRSGWAPEVLIQEAGRPVYTDTGDEYLKANPTQRTGQGQPDENRLFAVQADGRVVAVSATASTPSVLQQPENSGVVAAAVNRTNNSAALVRRVGAKLRLWVGGLSGGRQLVETGLPEADGMSRPSFVPGFDGRVLVAVDGTLYDVAVNGQAQPITLMRPGGGVRTVTAVSVAPDGARVALVVDGQVVVAPMEPTAAKVNIGALRELYAPAADWACVGWLYEDRLVVGGTSAMAEVAIDNGRIERIAPGNLAGARVTQLSAIPGNPFDGVRGNVVVEVVEAGKAPEASYAYGSGLVAITASQAVSPAPSASGDPNTTMPKLTAPFYLDEVK
jgi:hypothetical protein